MSDDTTMPSSVQASTSMCGYTLRWLMSRSAGSRASSRLRDLRALADQHQCLGVGQPRRQLVHVVDVVGEHGDVVAVELLEARQRPQRVEPVVEDRDLHGTPVVGGSGRYSMNEDSSIPNRTRAQRWSARSRSTRVG